MPEKNGPRAHHYFSSAWRSARSLAREAEKEERREKREEGEKGKELVED